MRSVPRVGAIGAGSVRSVPGSVRSVRAPSWCGGTRDERVVHRRRRIGRGRGLGLARSSAMLPINVIELARRSPAGLVTLRELRLRSATTAVLSPTGLGAGLLDARAARRLPDQRGARRYGRVGPHAGALPGAGRGRARPSALISGRAMLALAGVRGMASSVAAARAGRSRPSCAGQGRAVRRRATSRSPRWPRQRHGSVDTADAAQALADLAWGHAYTDRDLRVLVDETRFSLRRRSRRTWSAMAADRPSRSTPIARHARAFEQESEGERTAFTKLFLAYPPLPDCQVVLVGSLRVDFVYLDAALVIEYLGDVPRRQGGQGHRSGLRDRAARLPPHPGHQVVARPSDGIREHIQAERHHRTAAHRRGAPTAARTPAAAAATLPPPHAPARG